MYEIQLLVTANAFTISPILSALMIEAVSYSLTSAIARATQRHAQKIAFFKFN
jgi:hypothetical protein